MNVYPFIAAEKSAAHHVTTACALLEVSQSAYYQWSKHVSSVRERSDGALSEQIVAIHNDSRETYGAPRVHRQLRRNGIVCGRHRVARLMAVRGLTGRAKRRWKRTTIIDPSAPPPKRSLCVGPSHRRRWNSTACGSVTSTSGRGRAGAIWRR